MDNTPTLNPYLLFNGNAKPAMDFYHDVFGGKLTMQTYAEVGMSKGDDDPNKDYIMHAQLTADRIIVMASDGGSDRNSTFGNNVTLSLVGNDVTALTDWFTKLSDGGTVEQPLEKQFWGDLFGQLTDKFGIHWMVNINSGDNKEDAANGDAS